MTARKRTPVGFDLSLGTWRMRNGDTVEIRESKTLAYENPHREFQLWIGWCEERQFHISWLGFNRGRYSAYGKHDFDLVELVALAQPRRSAA